jgi:hypothetical protein
MAALGSLREKKLVGKIHKKPGVATCFSIWFVALLLLAYILLNR